MLTSINSNYAKVSNKWNMFVLASVYSYMCNWLVQLGKYKVANVLLLWYRCPTAELVPQKNVRASNAAKTVLGVPRQLFYPHRSAPTSRAKWNTLTNKKRWRRRVTHRPPHFHPAMRSGLQSGWVDISNSMGELTWKWGYRKTPLLGKHEFSLCGP